jgi:hypothetical protein
MITVVVLGTSLNVNIIRDGKNVSIPDVFPDRMDRENDLKEYLESWLQANWRIDSGTIQATPTMGGWHFKEV